MNKASFIPLFFVFMLLFIPNAQAAISGVSIVDDTVFGTGEKMIIVNWGSQYSDYVNAYVSEGQIESQTGYDVDRGFKLAMTSSDEYSTYPLSLERQVNYVNIIEKGYNIFGWSDDSLNSWADSSCLDMDKNGIKHYVVTSNLLGSKVNAYCFGTQSVAGDIYAIQTPTTVFESNWEMMADGKDSKRFTLSNINNVNSGTTKRINNDLLIRWQGSLSTQNQPSQATNLYASKRKLDNGFVVFDASYLTDYQSSASNDAFSIVMDYATGSVSESIAESIINNKINRIFNTWTSRSDFRQSTVSFPSSTLMKIDLDEGLFIPSFQVLINGKYYIKVIIPSGQPDVTAITMPSEIDSNQPTTATVSVRNVGSNKGDFVVQLDCPGMEVLTSPMTRSLGAGATDTFTFNIMGYVERTAQTYTCTAKATDSVSQQSDTLSKNIKVNPRSFCTQGQQICRLIDSRWTVLECDGLDFDNTVKVCPEDQTCQIDSSGRYQCIAGDNPDICGIENDPCGLIAGECCEGYICQGGILGIGSTCEKPEATVDYTMIFLALLVALTTLFSYAIKRDKIWALIGLVSGCMIALVLYLIIEFIFKNWLVITLGGGIVIGILYVVFGGGIFIALFGLIGGFASKSVKRKRK